MSYKLDISYLACVRFYDNKILYLTKSVFDDYDITQDKKFIRKFYSSIYNKPNYHVRMNECGDLFPKKKKFGENLFVYGLFAILIQKTSKL